LRGGDWAPLERRLQAGEALVLVVVVHTQGSVPRERGAWMAVCADGLLGTIGGGQLEWEAVARAQAMRQDPQAHSQRWRCPLGPRLGQCCGGVVDLEAIRLTAREAPLWRERWQPDRTPVALFGGGHVGHALVHALSPLPFSVHWIDSRDEVFPTQLPAWVQAEHSDPVQRAVADLAPGSRVLVMSFSHAEDLAVVAACLERLRQRADLPFVGLIGSRTKWARFRHRLQARGYTEAECAQVTCPIGLPGLVGKEPAVIAASVVAQLLLQVSAER
jgi:xanthine dehydrogenase accessory factor